MVHYGILVEYINSTYPMIKMHGVCGKTPQGMVRTTKYVQLTVVYDLYPVFCFLFCSFFKG